MYRFVHPFILLAIRVLFASFGGYRAVGARHIPRTGGVLIASNHISDIDPFAIALVTRRRLWFMAKTEIFHMRYIGTIARFLQAFPVRRDQADRAALRRADELLQSGQGVVIFPEGRGSPDGKLHAIQPGAAMIALKNRVSIVPVVISGTSTVMPVGIFVPRLFRACTVVRVGSPISPDEVPGGLTSRQKREWLTGRVFQALQELGQTDISISIENERKNFHP